MLVGWLAETGTRCAGDGPDYFDEGPKDYWWADGGMFTGEHGKCRTSPIDWARPWLGRPCSPEEPGPCFTEWGQDCGKACFSSDDGPCGEDGECYTYWGAQCGGGASCRRKIWEDWDEPCKDEQDDCLAHSGKPCRDACWDEWGSECMPGSDGCMDWGGNMCVHLPLPCMAGAKVPVRGGEVVTEDDVTDPGSLRVACPSGMLGSVSLVCVGGQLYVGAENCEVIPKDVCMAMGTMCHMHPPCEDEESAGKCNQVVRRELCKRDKWGNLCKKSCREAGQKDWCPAGSP